MSFISAAAHQKFVSQCENIISTSVENGALFIFSDKRDRLDKDLKELEQLMETYNRMLAEFPKLTCKYYNLHRRIRVNVRKVQLKTNRIRRRNERSS